MSGERRSTGLEAFNRLFWDARLNRDVFVVGYSDRVAQDGVREVPLVRWDPKGNVPAHRILYIRCGTEVVWSRGEAVDRLASDDLPAAAWLAEPAVPPRTRSARGCVPRAVYRHEGDHWEAAGERTGPPRGRRVPARHLERPERFRGAGHSFSRIPSPVPPRRNWRGRRRTSSPFRKPPRRSPATCWQRPEPSRSFCPNPPHLVGLDPHGPFFLSRHPFSLAEHAAGHRPVPVGTWKFADRLVHVANVHLPSNRTADAALHRRRLLAGLFADLEPLSGDVLLVGDFNLTGDELGDLITAAGYRDVWGLLHPGEEGSTFDPPHNPLARQSSRTGLPVRFDRVLWKPAPNGFAPVESGAASPPRPTPAREGRASRRTITGCVPSGRSGGNPARPGRTAPRASERPGHHPAGRSLAEHPGDPRAARPARWTAGCRTSTCSTASSPSSTSPRRPGRSRRPWRTCPPSTIVLEDFRTFTHRHSCTAWLRPVTHPPGGAARLAGPAGAALPSLHRTEPAFAGGLHPSPDHRAVRERQTGASSYCPPWTAHPLARGPRRADRPRRGGAVPEPVRGPPRGR